MSENPYDKLSAAIKKRDRALTGIARWEDAREEAEQEIAEVTRLIAAATTQPEPVAAPAAVFAATEFQSPEASA